MSRSSSRRKAAASAAALIVGAVAVAGCGGSSGSKADTAGTKTIAMTLSDKGCSPARVSIPAGPVTSRVSNSGSSKVTEFELKNTAGIIVGEQENVVEGIDGSFSLTIAPGKYVLSCPNGDPDDTGVLTATGKATAAKTTRGTAPYTARLLRDVTTLDRKVQASTPSTSTFLQTTSGLFAIPRGTQPGSFVGSGLFN